MYLLAKKVNGKNYFIRHFIKGEITPTTGVSLAQWFETKAHALAFQKQHYSMLTWNIELAEGFKNENL